MTQRQPAAKASSLASHDKPQIELLASLSENRRVKAPELSAIHAYWLLPGEPTRSFFAATVAELAARFDAPVFEPHVTIYASRKGSEDSAEVLSSVLTDCKLFRLSIRDIQCSDEFTKTVFVQFEPSAVLSRLSNALRQASTSHHEYQFNPHLSLIYKKMTRDEKLAVTNSIRLPFTEVWFDSAKAVVCPAHIRSREDVEAWRVVATQRLTK